MFLVYTVDTDTLEIVYSNELRPVAETVDGPKEWMTIDFDEEGRLVAQTIEHARANAPREWWLAIERAMLLFSKEKASEIAAIHMTPDGELDLEATYEANNMATGSEIWQHTEERRRRLAEEKD